MIKNKFDISSSQFEMLRELCLRPLRQLGATLWLFGSRARGDHRKFSDIDILFEIEGVIDQVKLSSELFMIKDNLENSNLVYKVDLVDRKEVAKSYIDGIEREKVIIELD